jgi:hypothetical protein
MQVNSGIPADEPGDITLFTKKSYQMA